MFTNNFRKSIYSNRIFFFKKLSFFFSCVSFGGIRVLLFFFVGASLSEKFKILFSSSQQNQNDLSVRYKKYKHNLSAAGKHKMFACVSNTGCEKINPRHAYLRRNKTTWVWCSLLVFDHGLVCYLLVLWDKKGSQTQYVLPLTSFCFSSLSSPQTHLFSGCPPALFAVISLTSERVSLFATTVVLLYPAHNF